jgi:hypothetical protein
MDKEEAIAWLKGERSSCNSICSCNVGSAESEVLIAQADSAYIQQAYWSLKAIKEGLLIN